MPACAGIFFSKKRRVDLHLTRRDPEGSYFFLAAFFFAFFLQASLASPSSWRFVMLLVFFAFFAIIPQRLQDIAGPELEPGPEPEQARSQHDD